jgi:hypothetical protein
MITEIQAVACRVISKHLISEFELEIMSDQEEPKIIVDDDWKSQVEKEKEQLKEQKTEQADAEGAPAGELPPASFPMLVSTLATQAMAAMGMLPDPATGEANVHRPMAKHFIDTLDLLQEKTKGNLAEEEETMLRDALHQLRMAFMAMPKAGSATAADSEPKKSSIELP